MNTNIRIFLFFVAAVAVFTASAVFATSKDDIVFPVAELGNCQNEQECRSYCDDPANIDQCIAFAELHNLMSQKEIEKAKKFQSIGVVGPGDCTTERECEAYCENINNIEECLGFAEQHGFVEEEELQEIRQVAQALRSGAQLPGGCTGKSSCEAYCSDPNNMRECIAFAEQAGFMSPEELKEAKQVLKALDAGLSFPGNCRGERECEVYCEDPAHAEECVEFALAAGFIPPEEADEVRRILPLMKSGRMPEGCRGGKEACETYCSQEQNTEECTTFFVEAGFMSAEEAELFRKTGGKGPGGCKGERECETFCNNPENQEECFAFAKQHGLIPEEELANIREGTARFKEGLEQAPPEVAQCLRDTIGQEKLDKIQAGTLLPNPQIGEHMKRCFEEFFPRDGFEGEGPGFGPPGGFDESVTPEQRACIERILSEAGFEGDPSPEVEARIGQECFSAGEFFPPGGERFEGEGPQGEFQQQFQQEFQQQFEQQFQEQFQQEFERQFQEQQFQPQQFEQLIPPAPHLEGAAGPTPEEIQRIEQEEAARLEQQRSEEEAIRLQLEQELQQQFQELEQLQQQQQQAPAGGSVLDVFLYFLQPLLR